MGIRVRTAVITAARVGPSNGGIPSTAVYKVAPSAHMSAAASTLLPSSCSGAMYCGVPTMFPGLVSFVVASMIRAMPKSVTMARRPDSSTLSGFRSRCTIPAACASVSASAICSPISATRCHGSRPVAAISAARDRPEMSSITIHGAPSCSTTSWIVITPGWFSRAAARASRIVRATSSACSAADTCRGSKTSLIATSRSSSWS